MGLVNGSAVLPAIRIVDATGAYSHVGLVQVRTSSDGSSGFGTVCGMNLAAADVICAQLGFDFGSVSTSPCGSYGGVDSCGASGMPVGLSNLVCDGGEPRISAMACAGEESDLSACQYESSDDVFCAPEENVVLRCAGGGGDSQGRARNVGSPTS